MKKPAIFILFILLSGAVHSQNGFGRYHKNLLYEADIYFEQEDYYYAGDLYRELLKADSTRLDIHGKLGVCLYNMYNGKETCQQHLKLGVEAKYPEAYFYLAKLYLENYRFEEANQLLAEYKSFSERRYRGVDLHHLQETVHRAIAAVKAPVNVDIVNLGSAVNSSYNDYAPIYNSHTDELYFTSRRPLHAGVDPDLTGQYDENIYRVNLVESIVSISPLNATINSTTNDAAVAFSPGGQSMLFFRTNKDLLGGNLFISKKMGEGWSEPEDLSEKINSRYQEASASYGNSDSEVLYFSSNRPGGFGGKDIYKVQRLPDGTWSKPQNLGPGINTPYHEDAPFISANGILYFSSQGHSTIGGFDIFSSVPKANGTWDIPVNVGYPINTPGNDVFFTISADGSSAYFSSERKGGEGLQDLYQVIFNDIQTVVVKGQLMCDSEPLKNSQAKILLLDQKDDVLEGVFHSNTETGSFIMAINPNKKYRILVEADGYKPLIKELEYQVSLSEGFSFLEELVELEKVKDL